jgi:type VI secretion system protein ImpL
MRFGHDNLVLAGLLVATLLVVLLLALVLSAALRGAGAKAGKTMRLLGAESLRLSFRKAVRLVEKNLAARAERYNLSWTLLLDAGTDSPLPLRASGLRSVLSVDSSLGASTPGVDWNFFDKGVVVQLRSDYLGGVDDDGAGATGVWDDFLGLCRAYRPQRPFDAIVLAIPCTALLQADAEGQLALVARAKALHRRLWLAQNRLAMRFPIHVVVSECEAVPGFASFGAALPEALRRSILGWASPYELVAPFRAQWIDNALDQIVGAVADGCAELCALEAADADSSAYLLLPGALERLRTGLKVFCEELMRPSAYHESFLLRGVYLTGDASPAAVLQAHGAGQEASAGAQLPVLATAPAGAEAEAEDAAPRERMPVFLRDIFERKVFAEVGLVRTSRQRMRHTAGPRLAWWAGLAMPVLWGVCLVVATVQLNDARGALLTYLHALDGKKGSTEAALDGFEALGGTRFYALAMPGSWPLFDDLHAQLEQHLEQAFAVHAVAALRDAARAQASRLTGVARDPANGALLENGQCTLPAGWREQVAAAAPGGLNLKALPEYGALMAYFARLDELDGALAAMERLVQNGPAPASGADLSLAVRVLLRKELRGAPGRTAALFRAATQDTPLPALASIQVAARCALRQASIATYQRLFEGNGLLRTERQLADAARRVRDSARQADDFATQLPLWQTLRAALDEQQRQLVGGQGAWMQQRMFDLGSAQDNVLKRVAASRLLGPGAADAMRDWAAEGFSRFLVAWDAARADPDAVDGSAGLAWNGNGWVFTAERKALHDGVTAVLAQPIMKTAAPPRLPELAPGATIRWERAQVERAASLVEVRKAFQAGTWATLPVSLQPAAGGLVDLALAANAQGALAQALVPVQPQLPSAASDAERAAVVKLQAWLQEIGARSLAAELDGLLARDALARLGRLDAVFNAAQLYVPQDPAFRNWQGQKGALLDAFGGGDATALNAYLEQQQEFVDTMGRQAEGVLAELASGSQSGHPLVLRWQGLEADLRRYRLKSPTSSRLALENFIAAGGADIDTANCVERLGGRPPATRGADVFAERLQGLQRGLLARCRELANGDDRRQWQHFAEAYNRDLGRRAPFLVTGLGAVDGEAPAADRDSVGAVMKLYDRARAAGALAARDPEQPGARPEVRKADQQLRRLRELLAPLYPSEDGQAAGLDLAVEFRANGGAEVDGNKIIDWSLSVGGAALRAGEPARVLRWEPGMPVLLSLRLARDGAVAPVAEPGHPGLSVVDRTVNFRFDDPWALFTFINAYRDADAPGADGRAPLLRFEFPLAASGPAAAVARPLAHARVFLRVRVSAPGKRTALAWPVAFPAQVPLWQEPQEASL